MIAATGWALLEAEEKKKEGMIELPESMKSELQRGTIVEVNPIFYKGEKEIDSGFKIGDRVIYKRFHDSDIEIEGKKYKAVPVEQIIVKL